VLAYCVFAAYGIRTQAEIDRLLASSHDSGKVSRMAADAAHSLHALAKMGHTMQDTAADEPTQSLSTALLEFVPAAVPSHYHLGAWNQMGRPNLTGPAVARDVWTGHGHAFLDEPGPHVVPTTYQRRGGLLVASLPESGELQDVSATLWDNVSMSESSVLRKQPTDVGGFLELSRALARLEASPLAIAQLTDAIDLPVAQPGSSPVLALADITKFIKRLRRTQLLSELLRTNRTEYVATVSFLNIPRTELPNLEEIPLRKYDPNPRRPDAVLDTDGLVPDSKLLPVPVKQNFLERFLLKEFRNIFISEAGIQGSDERDIYGLIDEGQKYMLTGATSEELQQATVRSLGAIMSKWTPFLLPFLRIFMGGIVPSYDPNDKRVGADPQWLADNVQWLRSKLPVGKEYLEPGRQLGPLFYAPFLTSLVAQYAIRPLAGPFALSLRSNGEPGGIVGERCIFLQESDCKGMCLNYCKLPAQELFEELGVPLYVKPNFETQECSWSFGDQAPPPAEDPTWPRGCVVSCTSREAMAELEAICE